MSFIDISYDSAFEIIKNYKYNKFEIILRLFSIPNKTTQNIVSGVLIEKQHTIFNIKYEGIKKIYDFLDHFEAYWEDKYSILFYLFLFHKETVFDLIRKENLYIPYYNIKLPSTSKLFQSVVVVPKGKEEEFRNLVMSKDLFKDVQGNFHIMHYKFEYEGKYTKMTPLYHSEEEYNTPFPKIKGISHDISMQFLDLYPSIYFFKHHILNDADWVFNDKNMSKLILWFRRISFVIDTRGTRLNYRFLLTSEFSNFHTDILFAIIEEFEDPKKQKLFFHVLFYMYYNVIPISRLVERYTMRLQEFIEAFVGLVNRYYEKFKIPLSLPIRREISPGDVFDGSHGLHDLRIPKNSSYYFQSLINEIVERGAIAYFKDRNDKVHPSIVKVFMFKQLEVLFFENKLSIEEFAPELRLFNNTFHKKVFSLEMVKLKEAVKWKKKYEGYLELIQNQLDRFERGEFKVGDTINWFGRFPTVLQDEKWIKSVVPGHKDRRKEREIDIDRQQEEIIKLKSELVDMLKYFMFVNQKEKNLFHKNILDYIYEL